MNRWLVVLGAVIIQINLGAVYAWSLFNQPLMDKFGWDREAIVLTFSITIATFALTTILAGKLQDKIGPRWVATTGGILLGLGLLLSSQATTVTQLYLFYGVIGGAGIGMTYVCPLSACVKWFPEKRGLISGIAVAGFGLGGLIFQPIIRYFIENFGVSSTFMYVGVIYLVFVVAGAQLLRNPPIKVDMKGKEDTFALEASTHFSSKEMLRTYPFYLLWFMFLFGSMSGLMVISFAVDIGVEVVQLDVEKAVNAVMVIALFNASGRIILGNISDRFGRVNTLMFIYGITALTLLYMSIGYMNYPLFLGMVSVIGFCFGGFLSLFPSITADYYGTKNMGSNYGLMYQAYGVSAFAGPFIVKVFPFGQAFIVASLFCMLAMMMAKAVIPPQKVKEPTVYREEVINEK
ncbi:OFA family MFS transporter [Salipaludibacillus sp. LMS25]|uniref:L-lactate MFS transporter n=1 Tax=Salipaludibacillus sp. LMS25 TaxID=2924031 RepID=UPI0020D1C1D0|nr:OFA family MFS transporter [Salipaludibacillus sp. LMS25]UTR13534.1 OFA family MFS transporter [Salipaludibacillus sp. LMS25]